MSKSIRLLERELQDIQASITREEGTLHARVNILERWVTRCNETRETLRKLRGVAYDLKKELAAARERPRTVAIRPGLRLRYVDGKGPQDLRFVVTRRNPTLGRDEGTFIPFDPWKWGAGGPRSWDEKAWLVGDTFDLRTGFVSGEIEVIPDDE